GREIPIPQALAIVHAEALCKVFYRPAILRIFVRDLRRPVVALQQLDQHPSSTELVAALAPILEYVTQDNPGFFTYRFGAAGGLAMEAGLRELYDLATWARDSGHSLLIQPIRRYHLAGQSEEIAELKPGEARVW
ncbi:MAG: hypothetical protein JXC32_12805, partial [Anaerolineae bacterium]|nr:hypothetical protein [Anaerolineae bacterium]